MENIPGGKAPDGQEKAMELVQELIVRLGRITDDDIEEFRKKIREDKVAIWDQHTREEKARFVLVDRLSPEEREMVWNHWRLPVLHNLKSIGGIIKFITKKE